MENREIRRRRLAEILALAATLAFGAGCRKPEAPPAPKQEAPPSLPMPPARSSENSPAPAAKDLRDETMRRAMRALDAEIDAQEKLAEEHQRTMVSPAPTDFKPEPVARKIQLRLILENQIVHPGSYPRFRLELTNVGKDTLEYQEYGASIFVKHGRMIDSPTIHFYLTDERNRRKRLMPTVFYAPGTRTASSTYFTVKLRPGETLHSIGDDASPVDNFKTLGAKGANLAPGVYRLQVELDDRPQPLSDVFIEANLRAGDTLENIKQFHSKQAREALGPITSNTAQFKVVR